MEGKPSHAAGGPVLEAVLAIDPKTAGRLPWVGCPLEQQLPTFGTSRNTSW